MAAICLLGKPVARAENLGDAWRMALSVNPQLRGQRLNTSAANLNVIAAERGFLPKGTATGVDVQLLSPTPRFSVGPTGSSSQGAAAGLGGAFSFFGAGQNNLPFAVTSLNQPIYAGGRIRGQVHAADAQVAQQKAGQFRTLLDLKLAVAEAYVGVLQTKRNLEVAKSEVARLRSFLNDVQSRKRVGMATRNEELSAEVSLANARLREIQTRNAQSIAWATYNRYLMRPLDLPVTLEELGPPPTAARNDDAADLHRQTTSLPEMQDELAQLTEQAVRTRPELAELSGRARALRAQAEITRSNSRPNVNVGLNYIYLGFNSLSNRDIFAATATGSWNFYDGGVARRQAQAQDQQSRAAMQQRADQAAAIALEVRTRWLNLSEARERVDVARVAVNQSEENVNVVSDRYRQQLSTYTEVLDAETQRVQAYANFYNAVYDSALAWFRLHRAVGDL
ncbi:MAG TPA: TolC family protein [Pirellulales bacterium]|nr:TolC family protein [Pirellulales bacterium]